MSEVQDNSTTQKRHLMDPDYEDIREQDTKRQKLIEQDAKAAATKAIEKVIRQQFEQEIQSKEEEVLLADQQLHETRRILDRLRACIVASYYSKAEPTAQKTPNLPIPIHPAVKEHLGKTVKGPSPTQSEQKWKPQVICEAEGTLAEKPKTLPQQSQSTSQCQGSTTATASSGSRFKVKKRVIVGNVSKYIPVDKREERDHATHKWMVYVRGPKEAADISHFVKKVWFFLHPSYKPNDLVEISQPPFHLTRRGWGEFPIRVQLHFVNARNKRVDIIHHLKLDKTYTGLQTLGAETVVDVELERDFVESSVEMPQGPLVATPYTKHSLPSPADTYPELARHLTIAHASPQMSPVKTQVDPLGNIQDKVRLKEQLCDKQGDELASQSGSTHMPIKPEAASLTLLPPVGKLHAASSVTSPPSRPQGLTLGADSLISGGVPSLNWSSLEIKSEPTSPEPAASPTVITSPDRSNPDDGYHSTSLPSTPERPPSASSFVKIEQGASPKLRINVGESHNLAAARAGTTLQIGGSIGGAKSIMQVSPRAASTAAQTVYVKCVDSKGKMYLVPQQALTKTSPSGSQGGASASPSPIPKMSGKVSVASGTTDCVSGSGLAEIPCAKQGAGAAHDSKLQQNMLVVRSDAACPATTTKTTVIGSGPNSATLTYMLTPNRGASSQPDTSPQAKTASSKQLQAQPTVASAPLLTNVSTSSSIAASGRPNGNSNSKTASMQLLIPGPKGTLQLVQTMPVPSTATRAVTPAKGPVISPGQSLLRKPSPGLSGGSRSVISKPRFRSAAPPSARSLLLLQGMGSHQRAASPSTRQQTPVILLAGNIQNLQGSGTVKQVQKPTAAAMGVSILKATSKASPVLAQIPGGEVLSSITPTTASNFGAKLAKIQGALSKPPDPRIVLKMDSQSIATPSGTVATVAQLLKNQVAGELHPKLSSNPASLGLVNASLAHQQTAGKPTVFNSPSRMNITLPKPSKKQDNQEGPQALEPSYSVNLEDMPDLESLVSCLVKQHPLVDKSADRTIHPYCARSIEEYQQWNVGKRRASEWMRTCRVRGAVASLLDGATHYRGEAVWSRLQIARWCRCHCFAPWDTELSTKLSRSDCPTPISGSMYSSCDELVTSLRDQWTAECQSQPDDCEVDVETLDLPSDDKPKDLNSPVKEERMLQIHPSSSEGDFVRETARQIGVNLNPIEVSSEGQCSHRVCRAVLEDMIWAVSKAFSEDLIRKTAALLYQDNRLVEEITVGDVSRAIRHMPLCDFLSGAYLGVAKDDGTVSQFQ